MFIENIIGKKASVRLLRILSLNPNRSFFQKELSELSGLGMGVTSSTLEELTKFEIVKREKRGRMIFFKFNTGSSLTNAIHELFVAENTLMPVFSYMEKAVLSEYSSKLQTLLKGNLEFIIIYGSRVRGTAGSYSDIDLLVILRRKADDKGIKNIGVKLSERFKVTLSPMVLYVNELKKLSDSREPLIESIRNENVVIYGDDKEFRDIIRLKPGKLKRTKTWS